ncbi:MAG: hypothetical protein Q9162_000909 [Coniocarpon cinnabarinum]
MESTLDRVESFRLQLEDNIQKLQNSLRQWRTWEAEYDALRDEVSTLPSDASESDIRQLAEDFGGEVVTRGDIEELIGTQQSLNRSREQVADLISRRLDWVQQNCRSAAKRLEKAQSDSEDLAGNESNNAEDNVPQAEIFEQLDENDNVIDGRLAKPGEQADKILDLLQKAGALEAEHPPTAEAQSSSVHSPANSDAAAKALETSSVASHEPIEKPVSPQQSQSKSPEPPTDSPKIKKSVQFAKDTKCASTDAGTEPSLSEIVQGSFPPDSKVYALDSTDRPIDFHAPHVCVDESPEDARLRREMMQYNMNEVNAIVAEMDLDNEADYGSGSEIESVDLDLSSDEDTEDSEEGEWGRSLRGGISDEYQNEMKRLEEKLHAQGLWNVGPSVRTTGADNLPGDTNQQAASDWNSTTSQNKTKSKAVRFAADLDIAPTKETQAKAETEFAEPSVDPVSSAVVERNDIPTSDFTTTSNGTAPPKMSRYKQAQLAANSSSPTSVREASNTLVSDVIERAPRHGVGSGSDGKKMSKFKAARINRAAV